MSRQLRTNEQGMAAIIVTVVLMIVISIITLGFAQTVRREQRNALDHQLTTQAFYAAESGVNLARKEIEKEITAGNTVLDKTSCGADGILNGENFVISSNPDAVITCLMIKSGVTSLEYQNVDMHATTALLQDSAGENITSVDIHWQSASSTNLANCTGALSFGASNLLNSSGAACQQPLLRIDIVPLPAASAPLDRSTLINNQYTAFILPSDAGGSTAINTAKTNKITTTCNATINANKLKSCKITITGLSSNRYAVRIMGVYGAADVSITGVNGAGNAVTFINGQVVIDSTAKSIDILKRIQVRMSATGSGKDFPDFAITAGGTGVCKRYKISAGVATTDMPAACAIP